MTFTCSSALLWTNWKGTVIKGEMQRVPVDLTVIICLGMKETKETSKGQGHTPIKYRYYCKCNNIDVDIFVSPSGSVIILHVISSWTLSFERRQSIKLSNTVLAAIKVQIAVFIMRYERVTSGLTIMVTCIPSQFIQKQK